MELKKSQSVGIKEVIATVVVAGILAMISVVVFSKVYNTADNMLDNNTLYSDATATLENTSETYYDSMELSVVAIIILAAAVIIGILIRAFGA